MGRRILKSIEDYSRALKSAKERKILLPISRFNDANRTIDGAWEINDIDGNIEIISYLQYINIGTKEKDNDSISDRFNKLLDSENS